MTAAPRKTLLGRATASLRRSVIIMFHVQATSSAGARTHNSTPPIDYMYILSDTLPR